VRLTAGHPGLRLTALTGESNAGKAFADVFPHLARCLPAASPAATLTKIGDVDWGSIDAAFCCLPHATTQAVLAGLPPHIKVVDLSADFRLADTASYEEWYGTPHAAPALQAEAVYGLTELARADVAGARLVANPGCYPTCAQLALVPLVEAGIIEAGGIIIDAKSGVSGAGRGAKVNLLYTEARFSMFLLCIHSFLKGIGVGVGEAPPPHTPPHPTHPHIPRSRRASTRTASPPTATCPRSSRA
jgi:N-acetyl-gamma-glutamyl-phosphate reductase